MAQGAALKRSEAIALSSLAVVLSRLGEAEEAWAVAQRAVTLARQVGSEGVQAQALQVLGMVASAVGAYEVAVDSWVAAISLFEAMGERPGLGLALFNLGGLMVRLSDPEEAVGCWLRSLAVFCEIEHRARIQTVVVSLRGLLQEMSGQRVGEGPITSEYLRTVWGGAIARFEEDFGQDVAEQVMERLVGAEVPSEAWLRFTARSEKTYGLIRDNEAADY